MAASKATALWNDRHHPVRDVLLADVVEVSSDALTDVAKEERLSLFQKQS